MHLSWVKKYHIEHTSLPSHMLAGTRFPARSAGQCALVSTPYLVLGQDRYLPFIVQGHSWGVQVGVLHGLHLWTPQEVVECVKSIRGPRDGLWWLAGLASGAGAWAQGVAPLHVMHGSRDQVTWRRGKGKGQSLEFPAHILLGWQLPSLSVITVYPRVNRLRRRLSPRHTIAIWFPFHFQSCLSC